MIDKAIKKINSNAEFYINADDINQITWLNGTTPISISDIQAQLSTVELDIAIANLRTKRNNLLAETDYLALSDSTLSDDMKTYRQNLRDLPAGKDTVEKCENATFPTKP